MKSDEILIVQCLIPMKPQKFDTLREQILKQKETGVILLPYYCNVITKPKDVDIQVEVEKEYEITSWDFIGGNSYDGKMKHCLSCRSCDCGREYCSLKCNNVNIDDPACEYYEPC